jgi:hypothetical protein
MALYIHSLMQNAYNGDRRRHHPVKHHMRAYRIFPVAGPHVVAHPPCFGIRRYRVDRRLDETNIDYRLALAPSLVGVFLNVIDVRCGIR